MKKGNKRFSAPGYQIFDSKPFIFSLKNNKFWSAWRLEPMDSHDLTALTVYTNYRSCPLSFIAKSLYINTTYAFDCCKRVRQAFFPFFFIKKIKSGARLEKGRQTLHVAFFLIARSSTRAADRRHSLVPDFHTVCVTCTAPAEGKRGNTYIWASPNLY